MARLASIVKANKTPKYAIRKHNRCQVCGRPRAFIRQFGLCRICFRNLVLDGKIPGVRKASW